MSFRACSVSQGALIAASIMGFVIASPALAQTTATDGPAPKTDASPSTSVIPGPAPAASSTTTTSAPADNQAGVSADPATAATDQTLPAANTDTMPKTDIFSKNTLSVLLDARLVLANGERSFTEGGLGKTRFQGGANGNYKAYAVPIEADLVWEPRFTGSLSANVSGAWQRGQENEFDLIEAFVSFLPQQSGKVAFSARAGLMWPEISLEHSTGGAWSVVNTITPSAINSWVGEEVKVLGAEGTVRASFGQHELSLTGAIFFGNDTSGTLLSFRGWALQDEKATGFGHFPLPPLNSFIKLLQQNETRSTIELDNRPGFYGRLDWRPPWPFGVALFYYDNRGNPEAFNPTDQWGWRTRFWNIGVNADLGPNTKLLAQGMTGSTIMGFSENDVPWVHTYFSSAFVLLSQRINDKFTVTGRVETFNTREHGSEMSPANSENGWAGTLAGRYSLTNNLTLFVEALNVRSHRGVRADLGLEPFQAQTVLQAALRLRI